MTVAELIEMLEKVQRKDGEICDSDGTPIKDVTVHHSLKDDEVEVYLE